MWECRVPARRHVGKLSGFLLEMGSGVETGLVARRGLSTFFWEKLVEETPGVVACDLKQGTDNQRGQWKQCRIQSPEF